MAVREDVAKTIVLIDGKQGLNELGKLELQKNENIRALKGMKKGTDEYVKASKQLKQTEKLIDAQREKLGLAGMTYQQLTRYQRDLRRQLNNTATKGTQRYEELRKKFLEVSAAVNEQRVSLKGTQNAWKDIKSLVLGGGILGLMLKAIFLVNQALRKMWNEIKAISEAWADVRKNTELTRFQILGLTNDLRKIDTKTPLKGLIALAAQAGKLGKKSRKDIAAFVKEADKIGVALGDDLGDDVEKSLRTIGKMVDIYKIGERNGLDFGESMNKLGSAINDVTTKGTNQAEFLVDYMERLGGMARTTTLTAQQNLGFAATFDELGQSAEVSGTVMTHVINLMHKDVVTFAGIAKMQLGEFSDLLKTDTNAALIAVLEGLNGNNEGLTVMTEKLDGVGLRGTRAIGVLAALSSSTDKLRERQAQANKAFDEGTSINNEFQTKMESIPASLERIANAFTNKFLGSKFVRSLEATFKSLADFFVGPADALTQFEDQFKKLRGLETNLAPLVSRFDELQGKTNLSNIEQEEMRSLLEKIAGIVPTAVTQFDEYGKAIAISTDKAREFVATQKAILKVKNKEAIEAQKEALEDVNREIDDINAKLNKRNELGKIFEEKQVVEGGRVFTKRIILTGERITELTNQLAALQEQKKGTLAFIDELSGANLDEIKPLKPKTEPATPDPPSIIVTASEIKAQVEESLSALERGEQQLIDQLRQQYLARELTEDEFNQRLQALQHATLIAKEAAMSQHLQRVKNLEFTSAGEKQEVTKELAEKELELQAEINESEYQLALAEMQRQLALEQAADERKRHREMAITQFLKEQYEERNKALQKHRKEVAKAEEKAIQSWHKNRKAKEENDRAVADSERLRAQAQIESAYQSGAAAVENAETIEEASVAVINSIRAQVKAVINLAVSEVMKSVLTKVPFPFNIAAATTAGALVSGLFDKLIPPARTKEQKKQGLFFGGDTGTGTLADGDAYGSFSNTPVHPNEIVIPAVFRDDPVVLNTRAYIKAQEPRFRDNVAFSDVPATGMTPEQGDILIAQMQELIAAYRAPKPPQRNYVVLRDIQNAQVQEDLARGNPL